MKEETKIRINKVIDIYAWILVMIGSFVTFGLFSILLYETDFEVSFVYALTYLSLMWCIISVTELN